VFVCIYALNIVADLHMPGSDWNLSGPKARQFLKKLLSDGNLKFKMVEWEELFGNFFFLLFFSFLIILIGKKKKNKEKKN